MSGIGRDKSKYALEHYTEVLDESTLLLVDGFCCLGQNSDDAAGELSLALGLCHTVSISCTLFSFELLTKSHGCLINADFARSNRIFNFCEVGRVREINESFNE